jgi:hypothetical protein
MACHGGVTRGSSRQAAFTGRLQAQGSCALEGEGAERWSGYGSDSWARGRLESRAISPLRRVPQAGVQEAGHLDTQTSDQLLDGQ